jgi:diguanylate cyclase (GGDEF)-like protein
VVLAGTALLAPGVLATQAALGRPVEVPVVVGASVALFLLVSARLSVMMDEREALEQRLAYQALHDPLTGLPNRTLFADRLEHALERARRRKATVAVLFMDLDNFKLINDSLGHEVGDKLLIAVARRLQACLRTEDTAARLGGDEFTILLEDLADPGEATQAAERIVKELCPAFDLEGQEVLVSASLGIALSASGRESGKDMMRAADLAMYATKTKGKAR